MKHASKPSIKTKHEVLVLKLFTEQVCMCKFKADEGHSVLDVHTTN